MEMKRVYVAGPYSRGDVAANVRRAYEAAATLADGGFAPFVPHHTHFWHLLFPRPYEEWLKLDLAFLCGCLVTLPVPMSKSARQPRSASRCSGRFVNSFERSDDLVCREENRTLGRQ